MSGLEPFRQHLDELDEQIVRLLGERFQTCRKVAMYKREHDVAMMQPERIEQVRARYLSAGADLDIPEAFTAAFFELLIEATCAMEDQLIQAAPAGTEETERAEEAGKP
ncbi:MAG TPA: chorismate mutase [Solirubrobacteraceae bacterium]|jgi:chorismate mutase-like protein|nr:chorismate mutase [Solirubrobacteraceae bacterium]